MNAPWAVFPAQRILGVAVVGLERGARLVLHEALARHRGARVLRVRGGGNEADDSTCVAAGVDRSVGGQVQHWRTGVEDHGEQDGRVVKLDRRGVRGVEARRRQLGRAEECARRNRERPSPGTRGADREVAERHSGIAALREVAAYLDEVRDESPDTVISDPTAFDVGAAVNVGTVTVNGTAW